MTTEDDPIPLHHGACCEHGVKLACAECVEAIREAHRVLTYSTHSDLGAQKRAAEILGTLLDSKAGR